MAKRLITGTLLGAVILYIWMMISWMVLPWHCNTLQKFTDEAAVASVFMSNTQNSGIFTLPNMCNDDMKSEKHIEVTKKGPLVFAAVRRDGFDFSSPRPYVVSFLINLVAAFFVAYLLFQTRTMSYGLRVWFVTAFGIAAGVLAAFPNWNWWGFSFSYVAVAFLDLVIGWFLAGLGMAAVVKRD